MSGAPYDPHESSTVTIICIYDGELQPCVTHELFTRDDTGSVCFSQTETGVPQGGGGVYHSLV